MHVWVLIYELLHLALLRHDERHKGLCVEGHARVQLGVVRRGGGPCGRARVVGGKIVGKDRHTCPRAKGPFYSAQACSAPGVRMMCLITLDLCCGAAVAKAHEL